MKSTRKIDLGFIPQKYPTGAHMCLIYKNEIERQTVISKFISRGLEMNEKVLYFTYRSKKEEILDQIRKVGKGFLKEKNLFISDALSTYCPSGEFVPQQMLEKIKKSYFQCKKEGYTDCRVSGEMDWALQKVPGGNRLIEYESLVNSILEKYPITAICQYDAHLFSQKTLIECLKVHPYFIINGLVIENPFYIDPQDFIKTQTY